ncbi:MAG: hypothetical protein ABEJ26_06050 [Halosimplex sp.]
MSLAVPLAVRSLVAVAGGLTGCLVLLDLVALVYWVRCEARARGSSTFDVLLYLFLVVGVVHYWYVRFVRGDAGPRESPPTRRESLAGTYALAMVVAFVVGAAVTPPDPFTQVLWFPPLFAVAFAVAFLVTAVARGSRSAAPE